MQVTDVFSDRGNLDLRLARDDQREYGVEAALIREARDEKQRAMVGEAQLLLFQCEAWKSEGLG